jgi:glutathione synthase/RimK-type ligase-like ATP-grasp enzyme
MKKSKLNIGIYQERDSLKDDFNNKFDEILRNKGYESIRININDSNFWEKVKTLDLFIFRYRVFDESKQLASTILPIIENVYKIKVIPTQKNCWHYDDKIKEYYLSKYYEFPMVKSWIFWEREKALEWVKTAKLPIVFKLKNGASSSNVLLVKSKQQAKNLIKMMFTKGVWSNKLPLIDSARFLDFNLKIWMRNLVRSFYYKTFKKEDVNLYWQLEKKYVLFQKFLPNNQFDTRVTLIGERAFAFRRFNRKGDFRSSGSGIKDYDMKNIDLEIIKAAFKINSKVKYSSMAFDFLYNENHLPEFCEMSYTFPDKTIYDLPGYWDPDLNFHSGHFWPQDLMLKDALEIPDFIKPGD